MADTVGNCVQKGIDRVTGREGTCRAYYRVSGRTRIFTVVDHEHGLRMPDYTVRVLAARQRTIRVSPQSPPGYPNHRGVQTSFELQVKNTTSHTLPFDANSTDVALGFVVDSADNGFTVFEERPDRYIRRPWIGQGGALAAGATRRGWVSFITIPRHSRFIGDGDLYFFDPGDEVRRHVGEIRLWR